MEGTMWANAHILGAADAQPSRDGQVPNFLREDWLKALSQFRNATEGVSAFRHAESSLRDNSVEIKPFVSFNMEGAIKINKEDFDMSQIPAECILTDMENEEESNSYHPYLKVLAKRRNTTYQNKTHLSTLSFEKRDSPIHGEIVNIFKPSKTIISTYSRQPRLFLPLKNRKGFFLRCFLPDELKQIQGFPLDYKIIGTSSEKITQIGNAVPPVLVTKIAEELINPYCPPSIAVAESNASV